MERATLLRIVELYKDKKDAVAYLQRCGVIPTEKTCRLCNHNQGMKLVTYRVGGEDGSGLVRCMWKCLNRYKNPKAKKKRVVCSGRITVFSGTCFENSRLTLQEIMLLCYLLVRMDMTRGRISEELGINLDSVTSWTKFVRHVFEQWAIRNMQPLGGLGKQVEIEECKFVKAKFDASCQAQDNWLFGALERDTGNMVLVPIEKRDAVTKMDLIKKWILPGTTVISGDLKAYESVANEGYTHLTVCHKVNFVDPTTRAHTNGIKSVLWHAKRVIPDVNSGNSSYNSYLCQYMFLKACKAKNLCVFAEFWKAVGTVTRFEPYKPIPVADSDSL